MTDPAISDQVLSDLVKRMRPKLHRYCSRMCGSAIEGEDVLQDAVLRAMRARADGADVLNLEAWLFRIAHNAALDHLRRIARTPLDELDDIDGVPDPDSIESRLADSASLALFMHLPTAQRSAVILMDVLGYSLRELSEIIGVSVPATKSLLHRGRESLQHIANSDSDAHDRSLDVESRRRLAEYIDKFNARDFDALREMLSAEVKLDLVARAERSGKAGVGNYFSNYAHIADWRCALGSMEGKDVILVFTGGAHTPSYVVLIEWQGQKIAKIRDFRYARYVMLSAQVEEI